MARRKPWYKALFERDYYDYFYVDGPREADTPDQRARQAEQQVEFIVQALDLPQGARVLDLCCGWGRHVVPLAQQGMRVTGLDLSAYHLKLAKAAAREAGVEIDLFRGDMREIPREAGRFDAIEPFFLGKLAIDGQMAPLGMQSGHHLVQMRQIRIDQRLVVGAPVHRMWLTPRMVASSGCTISTASFRRSRRIGDSRKISPAERSAMSR